MPVVGLELFSEKPYISRLSEFFIFKNREMSAECQQIILVNVQNGELLGPFP